MEHTIGASIEFEPYRQSLMYGEIVDINLEHERYVVIGEDDIQYFVKDTDVVGVQV